MPYHDWLVPSFNTEENITQLEQDCPQTSPGAGYFRNPVERNQFRYSGMGLNQSEVIKYAMCPPSRLAVSHFGIKSDGLRRHVRHTSQREIIKSPGASLQ